MIMAGNFENQQIEICQVQKVTDELAEGFVRLIPQLTKTKPVPDKRVLEEIVAAPNSVQLTACDPKMDGKIVVGVLTLVFYRIPTALRSRIEDLVVDQNYRGRGIGGALINYAIKEAAQKGALSVDLTSNPSRREANRLYKSIGFKKRLTNLYRYQLT